MRKLFFILSLFSCSLVFGQTESGADYFTRDTAIQVSANGSPKFTYWVRMTTHRGDTTKRPSIFTHNGAGEFGSDTTFFVFPSPHSFGPHFFLSNGSGWDGGLKLGNGMHYPNYFTVMPQAINMRGEYVLALIDSLVKYYPIELGSMHYEGLSMGNQEWQYMAAYYPSAGQEPGMQLMNSMVDLEGEGGQTFAPFQTGPDYPAYMGHWAKKYHGKFFGLEGDHDSRNEWQISQNIGDSTGQDGYFAYENISGGTHCCWNTMYDPTATNWRCISPITNGFIDASGSPANTMGNYFTDATNGSNIFQWMLRQGDTSIKSSAIPCSPVVAAGSNQSVQLPVSSATTTGTSTSACGHTIVTNAWTQISGTAATITAPSSLTTSFTGLTNTSVFRLTSTDNSSLIGTSDITITVLPEVPPTVNAGGPYAVVLPTNSVTLSGTATANGGASISIKVWTKTSGTGTQTITNNTSLTPTINGLVSGSYVFMFSVTDNNGNTSTANATIVVNPALPFGSQLDSMCAGEYVNAKIDKLGKLWSYTTSPLLAGSNNTGLPGGAIAVASSLTWKTVGGTLHGIEPVTSDGHVYGYGGNDQAQLGIGVITPSPTTILVPTMVVFDSTGRDSMNNVTMAKGTYTANALQGLYIVKGGSSSDTLFFNGASGNGIRGDGTTATDTVLSPVKVWSLPPAKHIKELIGGKYGVALWNDGSVWSTGAGGTGNSTVMYAFLGYTPSHAATDYLSWHQVTGFDALDSIIHITGGDIGGTLALGKSGKLYVWGANGGYLGDSTGPVYATPHDATSLITSHIPGGIQFMTANAQTFHVISNLDSLYGWGDNGFGNVGNGVEVDWQHAGFPYSGDPAQKFILMQTYPVKVSNKGDWKQIYGSVLFGLNSAATDFNDSLYEWGRNKGIMPNGVRECIGANGAQAAAYPNSWDVPDVTMVSPLAVTASIPTPCPGCINGAVTANCSLCTVATTVTTARAGSNQTIATRSTTLDGSGSTCTGGAINYYKWTQIGGTPAVMDVRAGKRVNLSGLTGTTTWQLTVIDNAWTTSTSTVTVTVSIVTSIDKLFFATPTTVK